MSWQTAAHTRVQVSVPNSHNGDVRAVAALPGKDKGKYSQRMITVVGENEIHKRFERLRKTYLSKRKVEKSPFQGRHKTLKESSEGSRRN